MLHYLAWDEIFSNIFWHFFATRVILDIIITSENNNQYYTCSGRITTNLWMLLVNGWQKYWKISLVVMVITCENIGFITRGFRPLVINSIFSLVITMATHNIFQYILRAMKDSLNLWDDANKVQICSQKDRKEVFWVIWSNIFDILTTQFS